MTPEFDDDELTREIERLHKTLALCVRHGEADGKDAVSAQLRALVAERTARARG